MYCRIRHQFALKRLGHENDTVFCKLVEVLWKKYLFERPHMNFPNRYRQSDISHSSQDICRLRCSTNFKMLQIRYGFRIKTKQDKYKIADRFSVSAILVWLSHCPVTIYIAHAKAKSLQGFKSFGGIFLFKAGNHIRRYHYGPGFQKHPVAKVAFDLEGEIWGSNSQMKKNFFKIFIFCLVLSCKINFGMNNRKFNDLQGF